MSVRFSGGLSGRLQSQRRWIGGHYEVNPLPEVGDPGVDGGHAFAVNHSPTGQSSLIPGTVLETGHWSTAVTLKQSHIYK